MKKEVKTLSSQMQTRRKLSLHRETLRRLHDEQVREAAGGRTRNTCGIACTVVDCV